MEQRYYLIIFREHGRGRAGEVLFEQHVELASPRRVVQEHQIHHVGRPALPLPKLRVAPLFIERGFVAAHADPPAEVRAIVQTRRFFTRVPRSQLRRHLPLDRLSVSQVPFLLRGIWGGESEKKQENCDFPGHNSLSFSLVSTLPLSLLSLSVSPEAERSRDRRKRRLKEWLLN
eukprot:scaffold4840_cov275-Pinguiococcus_pyrenoidosus.AAC.4